MKQILPIVVLTLLSQIGIAQLPISADFKNHLVLNGTTNFVNIPANPAMAITGDATIEAVIRTDNATLLGQDIIFINCIEPDNWGIQIQLTNGKPSMVIFNGNTYIATSLIPVSPNQTYHLAGVRNGTNIYLYVDGVLQAQSTASSNPLRNNPNSISRIGRPQNSQVFFFGGCLDELRIWNIARTQTQIVARRDTTLAGNEPGLVAYYQFDDIATGQNQNVKNSALITGSALDGTTVGDNITPYFSDICPSVYCNSLVFNNLPSATVRRRNSYCFDGVWKNFYDSSNTNNILTSVDENGQSLGNIYVDEYLDPNAGTAGADKYMRRHYVVTPTLATTNTKKIRLYYSNSDFSNLQAVVPTLTSASQLVVTKYKGLTEDSVYNTSGGTTTFIPSSQITTGTVFGQNYLEFNVSDFGEFWIHAGSYTLPLNLINFTATKRNNQILLNWMTENEINVSHFEVERSSNGRDFTFIGIKNANNQLMNKYSLADLSFNGFSSTLYYRIKQIDNNGSFKYSFTVKVTFLKQLDVTILPNPAKNLVTISALEAIVIELINLNGQLLKKWKPNTNGQYNIGEVTNGLYLIRIVTKETSQVEKLLIQK